MGQLMVNGAWVGYDKHTNTYLATLPHEQWGEDLLATITLTDSTAWENVMVNDQSADSLVVLEKVGPEKTYAIAATIGDSVVSARLAFTYLPLMHLFGVFGYEQKAGTVVLQQPGMEPEMMDANIKWRGNTTNQPFKHKRNYRLNFVNKKGEKVNRRFFSLRKDDDWILDAGQTDLFRLRNLIAAELWDDFATQPYYADEDDKIHTCSRGEVVEVFLNDEYMGIYNLCEPIDQRQLQVRRFDTETGEVHGGIWKSYGWDEASFWYQPPPYDNTLPEWGDFELVYPKIEDLCPSDYSTLYDAIDFVINSSDSAFVEQVSDYIDLPVFNDYILFMNVINAFDLAGKNLIWAVYDKQEDKKITPVMWDLDSTAGQNFNENPPHLDPAHYESWPKLPTKIAFRLFWLNPDDYRGQLAKRYFTLRKDIFSYGSLIGRYDSYYQKIYNCGATTREERRWSGDPDIADLPLDFANELEFIKEWLQQRLDYLDSFFNDPLVIRNVRTDIPAQNMEFNPLGERASSSYRGIVITKGRKDLRH